MRSSAPTMPLDVVEGHVAGLAQRPQPAPDLECHARGRGLFFILVVVVHLVLFVMGVTWNRLGTHCRTVDPEECSRKPRAWRRPARMPSAGALLTTLDPSWEPRSESVRKAARLDKIVRPGRQRSVSRAPRERRYGSRSRRSWLGVLFGVGQLMGDDDAPTPTRRRATRRRPPRARPTDHARVHEPRSRRAGARPRAAHAAAAAGRHAAARSSPPPSSRARATGPAAGDIDHRPLRRACCPTGPSSTSRGRRGSPSPSTIGTGEVIPGWDEGLDRGEDRRAPPPRDRRRQRLRRRGQGSIPPNAPLAFDVDVVDIQPAAG